MNIKKIILSLLITIFTLWIGGFVYYIKYINSYDLENRNITDAIIVFGAKKQRLYTATRLLKYGYAPIVYVAGNKPAKEYENFLRAYGVTPEQFVFDDERKYSRNDYIEETVDFITDFQLESIRFVTSAAIMPRAFRDLQERVPEGVTIIPHPVSTKHHKYAFIFKEYNKFLAAYILYFLGLLDDISLSYS
ncbi:MAG: YdcF family protein [Rickettsiaceae bacterium]|nr:YdcF family protein [Rickettsiaceae bacterium]